MGKMADARSRIGRKRRATSDSDGDSRSNRVVRSRGASFDHATDGDSRSDRVVRSRGTSFDHAAIGYHHIDSEVKFLLEVTNETKWRLWPGECYIHWGYIPSPPTMILPGEKVSITGHNQEGHYARDRNHNVYDTGATGVASWKIGKTGKKLAIMYSLPFNFDLWKNKLGIAIVDENERIDKIFCRRMIVDDNLAARREFFRQIKPIKVKSGQFHVIGTMGTSQHCQIKITFMSTEEQNHVPRLLPEHVPGSVTPLKEEGEKTSGPPSSTPSRLPSALPFIDLTGPI